MPSLPSKAGSSTSNQPERKQEHRYSDEDLKIRQQRQQHDVQAQQERQQQQREPHHYFPYEQPVHPRTTPPRRPAGPRSSKRPSVSPSVPPSSFSEDQSLSPSYLSNPTKSASGLASTALQPHTQDLLQEPSRKTSKAFSLRSEPSSVASLSSPSRSSTMPTPTRDAGPSPIPRVSSRKSEPDTYGGSPQRSDNQAHPHAKATSIYHHPQQQQRQQQRMPSPHSHTNRSISAPQSPSYRAHHPHPSTGYMSEGGTSVASVVDMKRLLSKPALPSSPSLPSNSDSDASGSRTHTRTEKKKDGLEPTASSSRHTLDESTFSRRQIKREVATHDMPLDAPAIPSTLQSTSSLQDPSSSPPREMKPRTLKRRPSGPRSPPLPSLPSSSAAEVNRDDTPHQHLTIDSASTKRAGYHEREASRSPTSSPLTPAGAVAEAYKQQAQNGRVSMGSGNGSGSGGSGGDDTPRISPALFSDTKRVEAGEGEVEPSMPYFTVFGGISGRLVAVGGPEDILLDGYQLNGRHRSSKPEPGAGQSLTRKVSAKWKKATGGAIRGDRSPDDTSASSSGTDHASTRERRSLSLPATDGSRLVGGSFGVHSPSAISTGESMQATQNVLTAKAWSPGPAEEDVRAKPGKLVKARSGDRERDSPKEKENEEEGGIIWKLMKRISTGGLRERYNQAADKPPPPVPALPKTVRQSVDGDPSGVLSRFMNSRASTSAIASGSHRSGSPRASSSQPHRVGPSSTGPRPSTTTGSSSSPVSSDFASSQFFQPTHSAGSSSSSYGEEAPPPDSSPMIAQHIIPPSELYRMNINHENEINYPKPYPKPGPRTPNRSASAPVCDSLPPPDNSPEEIRGTLPFPPRRFANTGNSSQQQRHSKTSPSKPDAISSFKRQTSPPPRLSGQHDCDISRPSLTILMPQSDSDDVIGNPSRLSSKRPRHDLGSTSPAQSLISPPTISLTDEQQDNCRLAEDPHRKSSGGFSNASTVRQRSSPFGASHARSSPSSARSPLTFRELGSGLSARTPLTAQEKADIWDDLLERSDRAGGTIHLGGQELMSDQMSLAGGSRLSNYTETTDIP